MFEYEKAAGGILTAKQASHRPGTALALGLRAGRIVSPFVEQTTIPNKICKGGPMFLVELELPGANVGGLPAEQSTTTPTRAIRHEYTRSLPALLSQLGVSLLVLRHAISLLLLRHAISISRAHHEERTIA